MVGAGPHANAVLPFRLLMQPDRPDEAADVDIDLLEYLQTLTPAERIRRMLDAAALVRALREAGKKHRADDSGSPPTTR